MTNPWDNVINSTLIDDLYCQGMSLGGLSSDPKPGCVDGCLGGAWNAEGYRQDEGMRLGMLFAVYLYWYLVRNHCFTDGNKRIGWMCLVYVLRKYRLAIVATDNEAVELTLRVAAGGVSVDDIIYWLEDGHLGAV